MRPLNESRWRRLQGYFKLAWAITFFVVAFAFSTERIRYAFSSEAWETWPLPQLSAAVLLFALALVFLWYHAVDGEMRMLNDYAREFAPDPPGGTFNAAIALSVVLGLLVYFSYRPLFFATLYVGLKVSELWIGSMRNKKLSEGFSKARDSSPPDDPRRTAWAIIEDSYLAKRVKVLAFVELGLASIALALAVVGEFLDGSEWGRWLSSGAYLVIMGTMVANERCLSRERHRRDVALGERYW